MIGSSSLRAETVAIGLLAALAAGSAGFGIGAARKLERSVVEQVNSERGRRGLAPLEVDESLAELAREHSEAMAKGRRSFGHQGFEKRARKIARLGGEASAENVALNLGLEEPANEAVAGWIKSSGHRENLLGDFTITGAGAAQGSDGTWYFTQLYARKQD